MSLAKSMRCKQKNIHRASGLDCHMGTSKMWWWCFNHSIHVHTDYRDSLLRWTTLSGLSLPIIFHVKLCTAACKLFNLLVIFCSSNVLTKNLKSQRISNLKSLTCSSLQVVQLAKESQISIDQQQKKKAWSGFCNSSHHPHHSKPRMIHLKTCYFYQQQWIYSESVHISD